VLDYNLTFVLADDIRAVSRLGALHILPMVLHNAIQVYAGPVEPFAVPKTILTFTPRNLDWKQVSQEAVARTYFYTLMVAVCLNYNSQLDGTCMETSMQGFGMSQIRWGLQKFVGRFVQKCIPMKVGCSYLGNEPVFFGSVVWPVIKTLVSEKVLHRLKVMGKDYTPLLKELSPSLVMVELGGTLDLHYPGAYEERAQMLETLHQMFGPEAPQHVPMAAVEALTGDEPHERS